MTGWRYANVDLLVLRKPPPRHSHGQRKIMPEPPGYDGISAVIHDGRFAPRYSLSVWAQNETEHAVLYALFEAAADGDFEVPHGADAWVYAGATVEGTAEWQKERDGTHTARVTIVCPNPRPRWKSTGELVF